MNVQRTQGYGMGFGTKQVDYAKLLTQKGITMVQRGGNVVASGAKRADGKFLDPVVVSGKDRSAQAVYNQLVSSGAFIPKETRV